MDSINKPKNQAQQVIHYLFYKDKVTVMSVIKDSMFYKFSTILSKIEREYGTIADRKRISFN